MADRRRILRTGPDQAPIQHGWEVKIGTDASADDRSARSPQHVR